MAKQGLKSLADLKDAIDFTEYYQEQERKAREEKRRKESTMEGLGFEKNPSNKALNQNKAKHRAKQYTLNMEEEDEVEDDFATLFSNQYGDVSKNKVLDRNKSRYKR